MRDAAIRALDSILEDESPVTALLHPLQFICLPLVREGEYGMCLHVWDPDSQRELPFAPLTTSRVHAHSWDLVSHVLYGEVRNNVFSVSDTETNPEHRIVEIHSDSERGIDAIRPTPRLVSSAVIRSDLYGEGDSYDLGAGIFHTTEVEGAAATLAFGRGRAKAVDLSLANIGISPHTVPRRRCDQETTRRLVRPVLDRLREAVPSHR
ncbi:hypothetical protein [Nocardia concava]|uniref:hypothetical protein n=1 Tax=Nocardia concava TaxID=257281 RepID=UPI00031DDEB0|nr:hypothetical protein [Nocardia concava]